MKIISNSSNLPLAKKIAGRLGAKFANVNFSKFPNGEKRIRILENLENENIIFVQSLSPSVDEKIIETLLVLNALETQGVKSVKLIIPWLGYSLQDKVFRKGEPLSVKVIINLFTSKIISKIILLDVHKKNSLKYFKRPTEHKSAVNLFSEDIKNRFKLDNVVVASTDKGGVKMTKYISRILNLPLIITSKSRNLESGEIHINEISGTVRNKIVVLIDDGIITGNTLSKVSEKLHDSGAKEIHFFATHAILTKGSIKKINNSPLDSVTFTNSLYHKKYPKKYKILDCSSILV